LRNKTKKESARWLASITGEVETANSSPLLIDKKAAVTLLSMGERTLWSLTKCRAIPSRKIGRSVRYDPAELKAWVHAGCPTEPGAAERVCAAMRKGAK
jgi:predicted DNA-binding transcriptional regulator AlpA